MGSDADHWWWRSTIRLPTVLRDCTGHPQDGIRGHGTGATVLRVRFGDAVGSGFGFSHAEPTIDSV